MEEMMKEKQVITCTDEYTIEQVGAILEKNNIAFIKKTDGSGSYINISMGQTIQAKRIFVKEEDYEKALKLIEPFITQENNDELDDEMEKEINKYDKIKKLMGLLAFGLPIVAILLIIIASIINK